MNHDKLRQQAEATLNHAYSSAEYILASAVLEILDEIAALRSATAELRRGDGTYYLTEERAMAPGIADGWPDVIPAPHTKNGRLVKRKFPFGGAS